MVYDCVFEESILAKKYCCHTDSPFCGKECLIRESDCIYYRDRDPLQRLKFVPSNQKIL